MNDRGQYGNARRRSSYAYTRGVYGSPYVGLTLWHSPQDKVDELDRLGTEIGQLKNHIWQQLGWTTARPLLNQKDPRYGWYHGTFLPTYNGFLEFRDQQLETELGTAAGVARRAATSWDTYENWAERIAKLRPAAEEAGFSFAGLPPPTAPPKSVADLAEKTTSDIYGGAKAGIGDVWNIAKYGLWGLLGLGTIVALSSVASNLKKGQDPAQKWAEYAGRGAATAGKML